MPLPTILTQAQMQAIIDSLNPGPVKNGVTAMRDEILLERKFIKEAPKVPMFPRGSGHIAGVPVIVAVSVVKTRNGKYRIENRRRVWSIGEARWKSKDDYYGVSTEEIQTDTQFDSLLQAAEVADAQNTILINQLDEVP